MHIDYVNAKDRIVNLESKICVFVSIPVPVGGFEEIQRAFTGVLYDTARAYRAQVDEVRRVATIEDAVDAGSNRVLFFRAHRRSGWYTGKDDKGSRGFFKMVFTDKRPPRKGTKTIDLRAQDPVASGVVDSDDHIRWRRTNDAGEESYLAVRVMKCIDVTVGTREGFNGLLIAEEFNPTLRDKLRRVAASIQRIRPETKVEIRCARA